MHEERRCTECGFALWLPIAPLRVSTLGLYDDSRYPGRCLLVLNDHYEDLAIVPERLAFSLLADARTAALSIAEASGAERINYAVLGNAEPHVHFHLVPRGGPQDPAPGRSPWQTDRPVTPLDSKTRSGLIDAIRNNVAKRLQGTFDDEREPCETDGQVE